MLKLSKLSKAEEVERRSRLGKVTKELEEFVASLQKLNDSAALIRQDRQR